MSGSSLTLSENDLAVMREDREGLIWLRDTVHADVTEGAHIAGAASDLPISDAAFELIVECEVSSQAVYTAKYRKPTWPEGASGVTIGIGYDVGYASRVELHGDFDGAIPAAMVTALEAALGVTGDKAAPLATSLGASVDVPWEAAITVHRTKVIPRWVGLTTRALANAAALHPDSLGALVSLTYNRGASFDVQDDRHKEMRSIKAHMAASNFAAIPADIRGMKRLWPTVRGLQDRREREAVLFEKGLAAG